MSKLPTTGPISWAEARGLRLPRVAHNGVIDTLARGLANEALDMAHEALETAQSGLGRARWGRINGDLENQTDLQEELAPYEHALCGGM